MGLLTWLAGSLAAFLAGRLIPLGRNTKWRGEALAAALGGILGGVAATALDFGGWKEPDLLAATFAALLGFAAVAIQRMIFRDSDQPRRRMEK